MKTNKPLIDWSKHSLEERRKMTTDMLKSVPWTSIPKRGTIQSDYQRLEFRRRWGVDPQDV